MKKKWESQRRQRQFLQQINEAREDQNQRKNPNFFPLGLQNLGNTCYLYFEILIQKLDSSMLYQPPTLQLVLLRRQISPRY